MKILTKLLLVLFLCSYSKITSQTERPIEELLTVLSQNHMGSVTDVFSLEEIQLIRNHFAQTTFPLGTESILENKRYASTQSAATIQACDINPINLTAIEILANSTIS